MGWREDQPDMNRIITSCALAVLASLLLAACDGGSDEAADDNILNVYNWADYISPDTIKRFEAEYGIEVNYDIYDSSEIVDVKVLAGNSGYDVIVHSNGYAARLAPIGVYEKLDFSQIPNVKHLDPDTMRIIDAWEGVSEFSVPYFWGTTGYAWNADLVRERLGDHPMDSADVIFEPEIVSKLADCGVTLLDSPIDVIPMVLAYLGEDPNSIDDESIQLAQERLRELRPYIRYFSNTKMLVDMPNKETCVAMSWSGDYATAARRAADAGIDIDLRYTAPKEGSGLWADGLYIPKDSKRKKNAHKFINFLLRPDIAAEIANVVNYATANRGAWEFIDPAILQDPAVFPDQATMDVLFANRPLDPKRERVRTRAYAHAKSGL